MEKKDTKTQLGRITAIAIPEALALNPFAAPRLRYDVEDDRVILTIGGERFAYGPKEWFMSDDELKRLIRSDLISVLGTGPIKPPVAPI